jgi:hypothetical protein
MTPVPTPTIPLKAWIRINEIHADPDPELGDANMDGEVHSDDDEFLEIVNAGSGYFDLSGWKILDRVKTRFVFPDDVILNSGCGLVIYGGQIELKEIAGSQIFSASSLGLNNSGDTIYLLDQNEKVYLSHTYGPEGGQNQSLTRFPDIEGGLPFLLHKEVLEAGGSLFSPGTKVDGRTFGDCP